LMSPIWGVILGIALLDEALTLQLVFGAAVSLVGVFIILIRPSRRSQVVAVEE